MTVTIAGLIIHIPWSFFVFYFWLSFPGCLPTCRYPGRVFCLHSWHPSRFWGQNIKTQADKASNVTANLILWHCMYTFRGWMPLRLSSCWRCTMTLTGWMNPPRLGGCQHQSRSALSIYVGLLWIQYKTGQRKLCEYVIKSIWNRKHWKKKVVVNSFLKNFKWNICGGKFWWKLLVEFLWWIIFCGILWWEILLDFFVEMSYLISFNPLLSSTDDQQQIYGLYGLCKTSYIAHWWKCRMLRFGTDRRTQNLSWREF